MLQSRSPPPFFFHIHTVTLPWLYRQSQGRVNWGGRVPYMGGHSQLWVWYRAACRPHPQDILLCDKVFDICASHRVAWHCRVIRKRYQPGDRGCCFVTHACPCTTSELGKYKGDISPRYDKNDILDGHIRGSWHRFGYTLEA